MPSENKPCKYALRDEYGWTCGVYNKTYCVHQDTAYDDDGEVLRCICALDIREKADVNLIRLGNVAVTRLSSTYDPRGGELFPITIGFTKQISDTKLRQLAALAAWIQDREDPYETP